MKRISYEAALKQGLTHFFTGEKCRNGHVSQRYVCNKDCVECSNYQHARYYETHRDEINEYNRKRQRTAKARAYQKYYRSTPEQLEYQREYQRTYYKNNPEQLVKRRARARFNKMKLNTLKKLLEKNND